MGRFWRQEIVTLRQSCYAVVCWVWFVFLYGPDPDFFRRRIRIVLGFLSGTVQPQKQLRVRVVAAVGDGARHDPPLLLRRRLLRCTFNQGFGSGFGPKKTNPVLCTSNGEIFLKYYQMNGLDNFKSLLFCVHTFGTSHSIDVLEPENQTGSGL